MQVRPNNPLIVQGDGKILLEAKHKKYEEVRDFLSRFSELEASPELLHTYKVTPLSLWNAAASGVKPEEIVETLQGYSKFSVPKEVIEDIEDMLSRYGLVQLIPHPKYPKSKIRLQFATAYVAKLVTEDPRLRSTIKPDDKRHWCIDKGHRGLFKQRALLSRWPIEDLAGFTDGDPLDVNLSSVLKSSGAAFAPRDYQLEAAERWFQKGKPSGGCGVVVLACGAGKTIVGITAMSLVKRKTLILATNQASVNQWIREILDKTDLDPSMVGGYSGQTKEVKPVTVATYQILTWRRSKNDDFEHLHVFDDEDWGLVIYDEVHLLPAPVFGATASLQGRRRLGLTATLIREDGREGDVFSLVGPKRYELPWQKLQKRGFIAETSCYEVRIAFPPKQEELYEKAEAEDGADARRLGVRLEEVEHELLPRRRARLVHQVQRALHVGAERGARQRVVAHHAEEAQVLLRGAAPLGQRADRLVRVLPRLLVPRALLALTRRRRRRRRTRCDAGRVGEKAFLGDGGLERVVRTPRPGDMEGRVSRRTPRWEHEPEAVLTRLRIRISLKQAAHDPHCVPFLDGFARAIVPHAPHPHLEARPLARHHESARRALDHDLQQRQLLVWVDEGVA